MQLTDLKRGVLVRRYKRFLADILDHNGQPVTIHCPNTGAMTGCAEPGWPVWYSTSPNPKRKYAHSWEMVETPEGLVCVNTGRANELVEEALADGVVKELVPDYRFRREVVVPDGDGRMDFFADAPSADLPMVWLEVKSVTLHMADGRGAFPDAKSDRALKHVRTLISLVRDGARGVLVLCAQHTGIHRVSIAEHIDPRYAAAVSDAMSQGVEVLAYGASGDHTHWQLTRRLEFTPP